MYSSRDTGFSFPFRPPRAFPEGKTKAAVLRLKTSVQRLLSHRFTPFAPESVCWFRILVSKVKVRLFSSRSLFNAS